MFLLSLRWWKDHDVSQLVNKLRFHIASTIDQNGRPPRKMEGCSSKCCKYHMQNPANTMQHERVYIILYIYMSNRKNPGNTKYVFDGHWFMEIDGNC